MARPESAAENGTAAARPARTTHRVGASSTLVSVDNESCVQSVVRRPGCAQLGDVAFPVECGGGARKARTVVFHHRTVRLFQLFVCGRGNFVVWNFATKTYF